ncbi:MAG: hypothetical protein ACRDRT_14855 [Pseudonocardiaceae bacterium]
MGTSKQMNIQSLTAYQVAHDGSNFRMHALDDEGNAVTVQFPTECLKQLMPTLPRALEEALRAQTRDASLRLVHAIDSWLIEKARSGDGQLILTFITQNQLKISFGIAERAVVQMAEVICDYEMDANPFGLLVH